MISISELERLESMMTKGWEIRPVVGCQFIVDVVSPDCEDAVLESVIEDADVKDASGVCAMRNSFKSVLAALKAGVLLQESENNYEHDPSMENARQVWELYLTYRDAMKGFSL